MERKYIEEQNISLAAWWIKEKKESLGEGRARIEISQMCCQDHCTDQLDRDTQVLDHDMTADLRNSQ